MLWISFLCLFSLTRTFSSILIKVARMYIIILFLILAKSHSMFCPMLHTLWSLPALLLGRALFSALCEHWVLFPLFLLYGSFSNPSGSSLTLMLWSVPYWLLMEDPLQISGFSPGTAHVSFEFSELLLPLSFSIQAFSSILLSSPSLCVACKLCEHGKLGNYGARLLCFPSLTDQ